MSDWEREGDGACFILFPPLSAVYITHTYTGTNREEPTMLHSINAHWWCKNRITLSGGVSVRVYMETEAYISRRSLTNWIVSRSDTLTRQSSCAHARSLSFMYYIPRSSLSLLFFLRQRLFLVSPAAAAISRTLSVMHCCSLSLAGVCQTQTPSRTDERDKGCVCAYTPRPAGIAENRRRTGYFF